jgi:hypothetical protein
MFGTRKLPLFISAQAATGTLYVGLGLKVTVIK